MRTTAGGLVIPKWVYTESAGLKKVDETMNKTKSRVDHQMIFRINHQTTDGLLYTVRTNA